jgi:hypothetical protein
MFESVLSNFEKLDFFPRKPFDLLRDDKLVPAHWSRGELNPSFQGQATGCLVTAAAPLASPCGITVILLKPAFQHRNTEKV